MGRCACRPLGRRRAQTVVIVGGALIPEPLASAIPIFVEAFLAPFDREEVRPHLDTAIARRVQDSNLSAKEHDAARRVRV